MKTQSLITKKIDDLDVVIGFQNRPICPVSTQVKNRSAVHASPEFVALSKKNAKQEEKMSSMLAAKKQSKAILTASKAEGLDPELAKKYVRESQKLDVIKNNLDGALGDINEEMKVLVAACRAKEKEVLADNPVYNDEVIFTDGDGVVHVAGPRPGEMIKTASEIDDLKQKFGALGVDKKLCCDGSEVSDHRGKCHHKKVGGQWQKGSIDRLGDELPTGCCFECDLTDVQRGEIAVQENVDRIAGLSAEDKTAEFEGKKAGLAGQAQSMETGLKFDGDPDFFSKAQDFYNVELTKLKIEYGVE